ncbi:hypothetical protein P167DRAFT_540170 [Morchella conica CCBAS932]|uniref:Metallo-beta-lactamase domain-containing protein n=1 Tax=Morchella conica CCBAS932 TaxID=1392247 RepID=A0A3N4KDD7_9PEZI|nr:hypothetical protein P167DRAFT_540170 [Morchella conica CCBAS932]
MSTPAAVQETFETGIKPLAQIIMLDAAHGDSNIIDICIKDLNGDGTYQPGSWRRFLIDSGPDYKDIRENLIRVLKSYKQPKVEGGNAPLEDPTVEMVQFTHTDDDHCGGGKGLFEALETDLALREHFSNTVVAFHRPPKQHPDWKITFAPVPTNINQPYTVTCQALGWHDKRLDLEKSNVYLRYSFSINNKARIEYDTPTVPITVEQLAGTELSVNCNVTLHRRHIGHNTTHLAPYTMRAAHKEIFTANSRFPIHVDEKTQKRVVTLGSKRATSTPKLEIVENKDVPDGERRRASQMYYRVMEGLEKVVELDRRRLKGTRVGTRRRTAMVTAPTVTPPKVTPLLKSEDIWVPKQNETVTYGLATMEIVGPTPTIHHELIGDIMRVEYDQGVVNTPPQPGKKPRPNTPPPTNNTPPTDNPTPTDNPAPTDNSTPTNNTKPKKTPPAKKNPTPKAGTKPKREAPYPPLALEKDSVLHNMASIVTLFRRWADTATATAKIPTAPPVLSMLFTGDAHDRECQVRDTVANFAGPVPPRFVNVLKIPHHGSLCSTSVEFYNRITADVYLVCAKQNNNGLPSLRILEAIVSGTTVQGGGRHASIFFSNPDSLWNITSAQHKEPMPSNLNTLLSGNKKPGTPVGQAGKYDYTCYILKHPTGQGVLWTKDTKSGNKNAGIILLGLDTAGKVVVNADSKWWDKWDEQRIKKPKKRPADDLEEYRKSRK